MKSGRQRSSIGRGDPATLLCTPKGSLPERVSVLGMGVTGMSVACFLGGVGVDVLASDSRDALDPGSEARLRDAGVTVTLGANHVRPGDTVVISPGIPPGATLFREAHALGSEVISEPELFARCFGGPIVAITGTDGKSTVTTWIAHLLAVSGIGAVAGGNLGNPLIEEIGRAEMEIGVLEISAFQLITTPALAPAVALVTNLADDHLDHFGGDRVAYAAAKRRLVELCRPGATLIRADNDAAIGGWSAADGVHTHRYGSAATSAAWMEADALWLSTEEHGFVRLGDRGGLQLVGLHNAWNALGASIAAYAAGADLDAIREGLQSYTALPHRCAVIRTLRGVRWVNDSKGTTPHATSAALSGMSDPVVLIAGGSDKGADFDSLGALVRQHTRHVLLIGETAEAIAIAIGPGHPVEHSSTLEAAVERAAAIARPGDTVLLSPACASFDMFESYARRGECFEALVLRLSE